MELCAWPAGVSPGGGPVRNDAGAVGLFRGETVDFILAKAQPNDAGLAQVLYIQLPADRCASLAERARAAPAGHDEHALVQRRKENLLAVRAARRRRPLSADAQAEALYSLILTCQDSFPTVEGLLAGLVQGKAAGDRQRPAVARSAAAVHLPVTASTCCPVPARVGDHLRDITPCTRPRPRRKSNSSPARTPRRNTVFDWERRETPRRRARRFVQPLHGRPSPLDPSLVVEQTQELSRTTVWRALHKENLGRALAWVSRRAAIDRTVRDGHPADRAVVASILREDPTLSDDLRLVYARHLLALPWASTIPILPT